MSNNEQDHKGVESNDAQTVPSWYKHDQTSEKQRGPDDSVFVKNNENQTMREDVDEDPVYAPSSKLAVIMVTINLSTMIASLDLVRQHKTNPVKPPGYS